MENFKRCIDDVEAAMHYLNHCGLYNEDYILFDRKAKCFQALKDKANAKLCFEKALSASSQSSMPDALKAAFEKQLQANLYKLKEVVLTEELVEDLPYAIKLPEANEVHKAISSKLQIEYSESKGRHVTAKEDIPAGEVVLIEKPNVSWSHYDLAADCSKACYHCLASVCPSMAHFSPVVDGLAFCSWPCLRAAMKTYHPHERFVLQDYFNTVRKYKEEMEQSGSLFLALKAVVRQPSTFFLDEDRSKKILAPEPTFVMDSNTQLTPEELQLKSLYNMVSHEPDCSPEERLKTAIRSTILLHCLKHTKYLETSAENELKVLWLLYHLQFTIMHSVLLIYQVDGDLSSEIPLRVVGSGIYDKMILMNHSCAANTTRFYQDGSALLVTKRDVKQGEEVSLNYGIHHHNMTKEKRQVALKTGYKFECQCQACTNNFPLLPNLSKVLDSKSLGKKLDKLLNQYKHAFADGRLVDAKNSCTKYLRTLCNSGVKYPHKNHEIGAIALNSCWWGIISANQMINQ